MKAVVVITFHLLGDLRVTILVLTCDQSEVTVLH